MRKEKPSYTCMDSARAAGGSPSASDGSPLTMGNTERGRSLFGPCCAGQVIDNIQ